MINFFYIYALLWIMILCGYYLGWSDLCTRPIDGRLLCFLLIIIMTSLMMGIFFRKDLKFKKIKENPHKNFKITFIFVAFFILEFIYSGTVPLFKVVSGVGYQNVGFKTIPFLHMLVNSFGMIYSFYLSYIFVTFKDRKALYENFIIILIYLLCMTRQNILICLVVFLNLLLASVLDEKEKKINKKMLLIMLLITGVIFLYLFGVMGNMRYGSAYSWNDSSMICELGQLNEKYPSFLPKEFFWAYTYLVNPLTNLNYNVSNFSSIEDGFAYIMEFIPNFISNKFGYEPIQPNLLVSSLTVCTEYVNSYLTYGFFGMYFLYFIKLILCFLILYYTYKRNNKYFVTVSQGLMYFYIFSFFDNTFTYSITACVLFYCIIVSLGIKVKRGK